MPQTRRDTSVYLIGNYSSQIIGSKLPSNGDVLRVLFFYLREVGLRDKHEGAVLVISEVLPFWAKARIPTRLPKHCVNKLDELYETHDKIRKSAHRNFPADVRKREAFIEELDNLFDIAHADVLTTNTENYIKIAEDRQFLISQRKKGREGFMYGIDWELHKQELRAEEREEKRIERKRKSDESLQILRETCYLDSSDEEETFMQQSHSSNENSVPVKARRATKSIMTPKIVAALDKCKISDRNALHILTSVVEAVNLNPMNFTINRASLQRARTKLREEKAQNLKEKFQNLNLEHVTIHWDGKLFAKPGLGKLKYDRIAIFATSGEIEKVLSIPAIESSTGRDQAEAVYEELLNWNLDDFVQAFVCDTTSSNLGRINGAAVILEQMLQRAILYLACRHHIRELILRAAFDAKMPPSKSPEVDIFNRFKNSWSEMDPAKFKTAMQDRKMSKYFKNDRDSIIDFVEKTLKKDKQPRADYKEFLTLTLIFLGKVGDKVTFSLPGPTHHARWMAKGIYCLKIYLFRDQFKFQEQERKSIEELCIFIVKLYVEDWFTAPNTVKAPNNDLEFTKKLLKYKEIDSSISEAAVAKIENHFWYLAPETCALAFFDKNVSVECKRKMVLALEKQCTSDQFEKRYKFNNIQDIERKELSDFIDSSSKTFFTRFKLPTDFLQADPSTWSENEQFQSNLSIVSKLKSVNDVAERGVKLIDEYNNTLTKSEPERQNIIQIVSDYRKQFPDVKKKTLNKPYE